uniref:FXYD domain-containing ion transport regulator n=1 Tax=Sarcophilus harrisii TaxID=9305 RepID=A0A7N4NV71_SARHA
MQGVMVGILLLMAALPVLEANDLFDKDSPFYYDWHSLRVGGMVCAGILCAAGIIVIMSKSGELTRSEELGNQGGGELSLREVPSPSSILLAHAGGKCKCKFGQKHKPGSNC